MSQSFTTYEVLEKGVRSANTENTKAVLKDSDLFAFLVSNFNATLKLASGNPSDIAIGITSKALSTSKLAGKASKSSGVVIGATAAQIIVTAGLVSVAGKGPTAAVVAIGAAFAKKTSLALSWPETTTRKQSVLPHLRILQHPALPPGFLLLLRQQASVRCFLLAALRN